LYSWTKAAEDVQDMRKDILPVAKSDK
jgi:hypothetical protein